MRHTDNNNRIKLNFIILYLFIYMFFAIFMTFMPVYLDIIGFNNSQIGMLMAIGPFISIVAQPVWGLAGDRAKTKNTILKIIIAGNAIAFMIYSLSDNFYYLMLIMVVFTFFQSSILSINDAISLEYINKNPDLKYGPIRMAGTIGFAVMSLVAGLFVRQEINKIFPLYLILSLIAFYFTFKIPAIKGHQAQGKKVSYYKLFKNKELLILFAFSLVIWITMQIFNTFFPIYFKQHGASNTLLGAAMFLSAMCEVPFLIYAERLLKKFGIKIILISSALIMGIRWFLLSVVTNKYIIFLLSPMHGLSIVVFTYCFAVYISRKVPKELRASGQTLNALIGTGFARIIGNLLGGYLSDRVGINEVFLYSSIANIIAVVAIIFTFMYIHQKENRLVH